MSACLRCGEALGPGEGVIRRLEYRVRSDDSRWRTVTTGDVHKACALAEIVEYRRERAAPPPPELFPETRPGAGQAFERWRRYRAGWTG